MPGKESNGALYQAEMLLKDLESLSIRSYPCIQLLWWPTTRRKKKLLPLASRARLFESRLTVGSIKS